MVLFNVKENNTEKTFEIAIQRAKELGTDILAASTTGATAEALLKKAKAAGFGGRIIIITHAYGSREAGTNRMSEEMRARVVALTAPLHQRPTIHREALAKKEWRYHPWHRHPRGPI